MGRNDRHGRKIAAGALAAITAAAILAAVSGYYFPSAEAMQTVSSCSQLDGNQPAPARLFGDAPFPGYTYLVVYNTTSGEILSGVVQLSCELGRGLPPGPFEASGGFNRIETPELDAAWLNVTADPDLRPMVANGYSNAFYVDLQTHLLVLKPGVTFNSNYSQAYYNGEPIANGTTLPTPPQ